MSKKVIDKLGIRPNSEALVINAPQAFLTDLDSLDIQLRARLSGEFDYIHCFFIKEIDLIAQFPKLKNHLKAHGMFWVSWPKARQKDTDLSITRIIKIGYDFGLAESKVVSIDATWSAIKFTFPKAGKVYNNSYGTFK